VSPEASLPFPQRTLIPFTLAVLDSGDPHTATVRSRRPSPTVAAAPLSQPRNLVNTVATMRAGKLIRYFRHATVGVREFGENGRRRSFRQQDRQFNSVSDTLTQRPTLQLDDRHFNPVTDILTMRSTL